MGITIKNKQLYLDEMETFADTEGFDPLMYKRVKKAYESLTTEGTPMIEYIFEQIVMLVEKDVANEVMLKVRSDIAGLDEDTIREVAESSSRMAVNELMSGIEIEVKSMLHALKYCYKSYSIYSIETVENGVAYYNKPIANLFHFTIEEDGDDD